MTLNLFCKVSIKAGEEISTQYTQPLKVEHEAKKSWKDDTMRFSTVYCNNVN